MGTILKVEDINVYYGSIHAIKGISFEVDEGEVVTLIGANGAGKSTTLNTISGLLRSKTGSIDFMGESLAKVPCHKVVERGLALVPEGRRIFLQMTVQENLEMGAFTQKGDTVQEDLEKVYTLFPPAEGAHQADGRHPLRRRAADAGHGPGPDEPPQAADAGRALHGPWPPSWWSRSLRSSRTSTRRGPPSSWWSRTPRPPCRWPTGATCWRRARSSPPAPGAELLASPAIKKAYLGG